LASLVCAAQQPAPPAGSAAHTDQAAPSTVPVAVVVRDKKGRLINDLKPSEFAVDEGGKTLPIAAVSQPGEPPIILGLLFDTGFLQRRQLDTEREAARTFLSTLRYDKDKSFVLHYDQQVELLQDITASRQKLEKALELLKAGEMTPPGYNDGGNGGDSRGQGGGRQGGPGVSSVMNDTVFLASDELLKGATGRPVLVLVCGGIESGSRVEWERAIESAQRANAVLYTIYDPGKSEESRFDSGNNSGGRNGRSGGGWPGGGGGWPGSGGGNWPGGNGRNGGGQDRDNRKTLEHQREEGRRIMERMAKESGGHFFEITKKFTLGDAFNQIAEELKAQYVLQVSAPDGGEGLRTLRLTTARKDATTQSRTGFYTSK
jgi:VWFA-related protein